MAAPRVISLGSVTQDVFLQSKLFRPQREADGDLVEIFELGQKYEVDTVTYATGGGASNAAVTFARAGLHSTFIGKVGDDVIGRLVLDELHADHVETANVIIQDGAQTGYSTLLLAPTGERSVLVFHGDSTKFSPDDFHLASMEADWLYLSTLTGDFETLERVFSEATAAGMRIAFNPGGKELAHPRKLRALLPHLTILSLNKDEMASLFDMEDAETLLRTAAALVPIVVMTDGPNGVMVADGENIYRAGMYEDVPVIDRTGAGDAFCSGFVAKIALGESVSAAIVFASANSTSVVQTIGAKAGILRADSHLHTMPVQHKAF